MRTQSLITLLTTLLSFLLTIPALAQPESVTVTATPQFSTVTPGQTMAIAVTFEFSNHFHIWPNQPEVPGEAKGVDAIPTLIVLADGNVPTAGVTPEVTQIVWPKGELVTISPSGTPYSILAYAKTTTVYVPVKVDSATAKGNITITLKVSYQACDEKQCLQPQDLELPVSFTIGDSLVPTSPALFAGFDINAKVVETIDLGLFGWKIPKGGLLGYTLLFLVAFAGGIILNLTPCVLPVIPLKILGLQAQSGTRSRMLFLGFVMFCGLVFFWLVIGMLISFGVLSAVSKISSYWYFNMGIAVFMAVMGLGMFGVFSVGLPTWVYNIDAKHDSAKGSFGFGIMSAVLATPCVAPLAGGVFAAATQFPPIVGLLIFLFVGLGMGIPYLILAAFPKLVAWLPRAGPGSELLKQFLGMLMIAVSFFFLGSALLTLVAQMPYLGKVLHWWAIAIAIAIASLWLILRTWQITPSAVRRGVFSLLAIALASLCFYWANTQTRVERRSTLYWKAYLPETVDAALKNNEVVVMDFTAEWCNICKFLEATVLQTEGVEEQLAKVRSFKVDLTAPDAPGWQRLYSFGQKGVPTLVIMGPGMKEPWIRNGYTPNEVAEAIKQARGTPKSTATPSAAGIATSTGKP